MFLGTTTSPAFGSAAQFQSWRACIYSVFKFPCSISLPYSANYQVWWVYLSREICKLRFWPSSGGTGQAFFIVMLRVSNAVMCCLTQHLHKKYYYYYYFITVVNRLTAVSKCYNCKLWALWLCVRVCVYMCLSATVRDLTLSGAWHTLMPWTLPAGRG